MGNEIKTKVAIVSMSACEYLPPLISLMNDSRWTQYDVKVFTTRWSKGKYPPYAGPRTVYRTSTHFPTFWLINLFDQLRFAIYTFLHLLLFRPAVILDIERGSSVPVLLYLILFRRTTRLFMHYYEYSTLEELSRCALPNRLAHRGEVALQKRASWISQCNEMRIRAYQNDYRLPDGICHVIHNYPPATWQRHFRLQKTISVPVKAVFCGVRMDLETLYVREFSDYVIRQNGKLVWDIYLASPSREIEEFIRSLNSPWVHLYASNIDYSQMPERLAKYNVGVILYKGITLNRKYVECNKFYEFLSCGLDVWFSSRMEAQHSLVTRDCYPKVVMLDFDHMEDVNLEQLISHENLQSNMPSYTAEKAADDFFHVLKATI